MRQSLGLVRDAKCQTCNLLYCDERAVDPSVSEASLTPLCGNGVLIGYDRVCNAKIGRSSSHTSESSQSRVVKVRHPSLFCGCEHE